MFRRLSPKQVQFALLLLLLTSFVAAVPISVSADVTKCQATFGRMTNTSAGEKAPRWARAKSYAKRVEAIVELFKDGATSFQDATRAARALQNLPERQKQGWALALGEAYRSLPKRNPIPNGAWRVESRRLIERVYGLVERPDLKFHQSVALGRSPLEAYREYFERQSAVYKGDFQFDHIILVINFLKAEMAKVQESLGGAKHKIYLTGSFINGKANHATSDIDSAFSDRSIVSYLAHWEAVINDILSDRYPSIHMPIQVSGDTPRFYGRLNTVVIEIAANQARILVFEPGRTNLNMKDELEGGDFKSYPLE